MKKTYIAKAEDEHKRIDHVLQKLLPNFGLRARRRLCENNFVLVNGRTVKPIYKVKASDIIETKITDTGKPEISDNDFQETSKDKPYIIKQNNDFAAIYKPAQMHSIKIKGSLTPNMEDILPNFFKQDKIHILNRLDFSTSGILMLGFDTAHEVWQKYQNENKCEKTYLTFVQGHLFENFEVESDFDYYSSMVKLNINKDPRQTKIFPLAHFVDSFENPISLIKCIITKGARHQIRLHLASIGHCLLNDVKYNAKFNYNNFDLNFFNMLKEVNDFSHNNSKTCLTQLKQIKTIKINNCSDIQENFILHHIKIEFPNFAANYKPFFLNCLPQNIQDKFF